jgi:predicted metalloprotease
VLSRFGIGGVIVLGIAYFLFAGGNPLGVTGGALPGQQQQAGGKTPAEACAVDAESKFSCQVLASTEDTWAQIFTASGQRYQPAGFVFYGVRGQSGCGAAQSAMGPFYCPTDNKIYLDTSFYTELRNRFGAAGDFAQAYVIAHEVGHHIQHVTGVLDKARQAQGGVSAKEGNKVQVLVELQADCYAGVWAGRNRDRLEPGDVQEGMRAAEAIGDDALQMQAQGKVVPESFTHGTSAQRQQWLKRGMDTADPAQCDTFAGKL